MGWGRAGMEMVGRGRVSRQLSLEEQWEWGAVGGRQGGQCKGARTLLGQTAALCKLEGPFPRACPQDCVRMRHSIALCWTCHEQSLINKGSLGVSESGLSQAGCKNQAI